MTTTHAPPALQEATRNATVAWQNDLQDLFHQAKDRYPDVVWELVDEDNKSEKEPEEVWGHKAVVYARAPPSFQARYFSFRPPPPTSPIPYSSSPTGTLPAESALSLTLGVNYNGHSRSPSPFRASSPAPSNNIGGLLRLPTSINPSLFSNELEYLYTGKGFGEAFEFLFDSSEGREEGDAEEARIDKLRKDLVFMWRSRLYSDVKIALTGNFSSTNHESATAIFSSHRFILVSRAPYFQKLLVKWGAPKKEGDQYSLTLPSPPFTPASLHFSLGFIYTGTLVFSHRTFDLDTAFHIMKSAVYLDLDTLFEEIQARIVQEMMHGLFHAFLEFSEYEKITGGKWGTGGCKCRQCARRAPRVLEFSLHDDVKNPHLERGARRALVGLFGEGWCTADFAKLPQKMRDGILKGVGKRTTPMNVFPLLFAAHTAEKKLQNTIETWAEVVRDMIFAARKTIDEVLATQADKCFEQQEWLQVLESDGAQFDDMDKVEWVMESVRRGLSEKNAGTLYQTVVSSILLRPHLTETDQTMLPPNSQIRAQVEQLRVDILRWLRRRWVGVKQDGGFDSLDGWALKEISHEIEVPVEDMFSPVPPVSTTPKPTHTRGGVRSVVSRVMEDSDSISVHSLRPNLSHRNVRSPDGLRSSSVSVRSIARSTHSVASRATVNTTASRRHHVALPTGPRPDSKLSPSFVSSSPSAPSSIVVSHEEEEVPISSANSTISVETRTSATPSNVSQTTVSTQQSTIRNPHHSTPRPRSVAASTRSTRSTASTLRRNVAGPSTLRPPSGLSRPSSTASTRSTSTISVASASDASTNFETAKSELSPATTRPRRVSTASTVSTVSIKTAGTTSTSRTPTKPRVPSATPLAKGKRPSLSPVDRANLSPAAKRTPSTASMRSTNSTASASSKRTPVRKSVVAPAISPQTSTKSSASSPTDGSNTIKAKKPTPAPSVASDKSPDKSVASSGSTTSTVRSLKRKSSAGTITETTVGERQPRDVTNVPRGSTLDIGIPCIISSKRLKCKAYARYIGEVEGERGSWVGVEVPFSDDWSDDKVRGIQWNDGTWGGIRYFEIGSNSEWDDDRDGMIPSRRRRIDWVNSVGASHSSLKREGDQLSVDRVKRLRSASPAVSDISSSESRGLFVRPQQVLYVVDAMT